MMVPLIAKYEVFSGYILRDLIPHIQVRHHRS
jgi:hypothetical protein